MTLYDLYLFTDLFTDPLSGVIDVTGAFGWVQCLHLLDRLRGAPVELATDVKPLGVGVDAELD